MEIKEEKERKETRLNSCQLFKFVLLKVHFS